jgi:quercetin dioxygenase-like cupin family protein
MLRLLIKHKIGSLSMSSENNAKTMLPESQSIEITTLVNYSEAAVVSRTLVKNEAGTITAFAFDKDQGLSEHSAPFDALVQVVDGEAEVVIAGTAHTVSAGQMILMPADIPHALRAVTQFKMLLTMLRK